MKLLSLDQSLVRTGYCVIDNGTILVTGSIDLSVYKTAKERRANIRLRVRDLVAVYKPDKIIVERVRTFSKGFISTQTIIELGALVLFIIDGVDIPVWSIDTRHWKTLTLGKSNATKEDAVKKVQYLLVKQGYVKAKAMDIVREEDVDVDHDQADACLIGMAAFSKDVKLKREL